MLFTRRRLVGLAVGVFSGSVLLTGCVGKEETTTTSTTPTSKTTGATPSPPSGKKFVVGFAQANSKDPWRQVQNAALEDAAKKYPDIEYHIQDASNDNQAQIGQVETFLTQKINLLLISANEAAPLTPAVGKVFDAKIPVVLMERGINSDKYTTLLSGDNHEIGKQAGQFIVEKSKGTGTIVEIYGKEAATPTKDRHNGFAEAIAGSPGLKVVEHQDCGYERNPARTYMENVLQKRTAFTIIYAHNDEMALGAVQALKAAGKDPKQYLIVGIDGVQEEVVNAIKAGDMSATFKYPWLGEEAMQTAHDILTGKTVEKKILLPTERVTVENADAYLAKLPKAGK